MSNIIRYYMEEGKVVKGFLLINFKKDLPHLQHLYLSKPCRDMNNLRKMTKVFKNIVRKLGYKTAILHARSARQMKLIQYIFKKKPYALENNIAWYVVNI